LSDSAGGTRLAVAVGLALLLVAGAMIGDLAQTSAAQTAPTAEATRVSARAAGLRGTPPQSTQVPGGEPAAQALPVMPNVAVLPVDPPGRPAADELDVCGVGRIKAEASHVANPSDPTEPAFKVHGLPKDLSARGLAEAWAPTLQALSAGASPRQRAAALLMRMYSPQSTPGPDSTDAAPALRTALARLAMESQDPAVMAWAQGECNRALGDGSCLGLTARHWVRAEPGNLIAWLSLMAEEPLARAEALHGMANATTADMRFGLFMATAMAAAPATLSTFARQELALNLIDIHAATPLPMLSGMVRECKAPALADANRRQQCDAIVKVLVHHSRELLTWALGLRMAETLGWPAPQLAALQSEKAAIQTAMPLGDLHQPYSCASTLSTQRWIRDMGANGELATLRSARQKAAAAGG
jgi:hypothetical protein